MPELPDISPVKQPILLQLDALLQELVGAGFPRDRVGTPLRMRLMDLLGQLPDDALSERLKYKISALVCQSEEEQTKFYEVFDAFISRFLEKQGFESGPETDKKEETPLPVEPPLPSKTDTPKPGAAEASTGSHKTDAVKAARSGPITVELHFRDDGYRPWNLPELEQVVRPLREKELTGAEEWDIPNTIQQTIQAGGAPHFARRRRRKAPQYLFLIEQKSVRDHLAGFYADLVLELTRRDLDAAYYFYDRIPQKCWKDRRDPSSYTTIDRLNSAYPQCRLILVGEPDGLLASIRKPVAKKDQVITLTERYPSTFAFELRDTWAAVAMLNTRSTALWGDAELAMHQLFPIAPANVAGLGSLMEQWKNRLSYQPYYWKTTNPEPITPSFQPYDGRSETLQQDIKNLKIYLGRQGYTWLCAIAVYPEIYWQLTKILHDEAISSIDVPDESLRTQLWHLYLLRMSRLPWLRHGYIPPEFRAELREGLPAANAAEVRRQLLEVLQLDENKAPEGSYAEKDRAYTVALFDHERFASLENPDKERLTAMQDKLRQEVLDAGVSISDIEDAVGRSLFRKLPEAPKGSLQYLWVLWVDDSPTNNLRFQEKTAKENAIRFVNVTHTAQALETLKTQQFDVIVSDVSRFGDKRSGIKMMQRFKDEGIKIPTYFFTHPNYVAEHTETLLALGAIAVTTGFDELLPRLLHDMRNKQEYNSARQSSVRDAATAAKAVCRVIAGDSSVGTGFLTEGNYLFTAAQVLRDPETVANAKVEFNVELDESGTRRQIISYDLDPSSIISSPVDQLDFFRVKVIDREDAPLRQWGYLDLETDTMPERGDTVFLIHHAGGKEKQTETDDFMGVEGQYLYFAENAGRLPGAGGGPLVNEALKVVGIYHAWQDKKSFLGATRTARQAVRFSNILAYIQEKEAPPTQSSYADPYANVAQSSSNVGDEPNQTSTGDPKANLLLRASVRFNQGEEALKRKDYEAAQSQLQDARELYTEGGDDAGRANTSHSVGKMYLEMGRAEEALKDLEVALGLYYKLDFGAAKAFVLMDIGRADIVIDDFDGAEKNYREALYTLEGLSGDTSADQVVVWQALGAIADAKGDLPAAKKQFLDGLKLARTAGLKAEEYQLLVQLGATNLEMKDANQALGCLEDALPLAPDPFERARVYEQIAAAREMEGNIGRAATALNEAYVLYADAKDTAAHERVGKRMNELAEALKSSQNVANNPASQKYTPDEPPLESAFIPNTMKIFILCSPEDQASGELLNGHLTVLKRAKTISVFNSFSDVRAGEDWKKRLNFELNEADFILPLITINLFSSDDLYGMLEGALKTGKRVVPILVSRVDIEGTGLEKLRSLPTQGRWISDFPNQDSAYTDIVSEIRRLAPKADKDPEAEPESSKPEDDVQQIRSLIAAARLGDALKRLKVALPEDDEVVLLQGRLAELERGERLGILDRQSAAITRNQITAAALELTKELPDKSRQRKMK